MLYLGPIPKEEVKSFYVKRQLEYNENSACVCCKEGEKILGFCLFDLEKDKFVAKYIKPLEDVALADGILRSSLHVAAERNVLNAFYAETIPEEFLEKIGFIKDKSQKRLDIDKLFKSQCSCK